MRWLTAVMGRIAIFGTLWVLSVGALCCIGGAELDEVALGRLMRVLLFLWTVLMLSREGTLVDRAIQKLHAPLQELGLPTPGRAEAWLGGCLPTVMGMIFWMAILCGLSSWVAENKEKGPLLFGGGLAWTVATQVWLGLVGGGLSLARYRLAGRALAEALRPKLPPVAPWSIAAVSLPLFVLAFWGIPDPRLVMEGLRVASVVMDAAATAATAPSPSSPASSSRQATPYTSRRDSQAETVRSSYLVQLGEDDTIQEIIPLLNAADATATPAVPQASAAEDAVLAATWEVEVPANRASLLTFFLRLDQENVALVEPNVVVKVEPFAQEGCRSGRTALSVNDPLGGQNLAAIDADAALRWLSKYRPNKPARIAIVDTGVAAGHEELKTIMYPRANADDRDGHGTACAGIAAAVTENRKGIPSFNMGGRYLQVQSFPALAMGAGEADDVANAIWDAVESGAAVINLSFGAKGTAPKVVARAVQAAVERDVIVVAAAGNDGQAARGQWPANLPGVVVVGATDGKLRAGFSNGTGGLARALSAPGAGICVPGPEGYRKSSGTSLAAPLVSGVLGTMRALCPRLGAAEAVEILRESGEDRTIQGLGPEVRPTAALELLLRRQAACVNANIERIYDENYWENLRQQQLYREPAYNPYADDDY